MGKDIRYSDALAAELLRRIADGASLRTVCSQEDMPTRETWRQWQREHPELPDQYARARAARAQERADEIVAIADDETIPVESRKVRIDARKWEASKLDRANYGDRQHIEHSGAIADGLTDEQRAKRMAEILRAARSRKSPTVATEQSGEVAARVCKMPKNPKP
jgi:type III secretion system FlhB-like substrate exporter